MMEPPVPSDLFAQAGSTFECRYYVSANSRRQMSYILDEFSGNWSWQAHAERRVCLALHAKWRRAQIMWRRLHGVYLGRYSHHRYLLLSEPSLFLLHGKGKPWLLVSVPTGSCLSSSSDLVSQFDLR